MQSNLVPVCNILFTYYTNDVYYPTLEIRESISLGYTSTQQDSFENRIQECEEGYDFSQDNLSLACLLPTK